MGRPVGSKNKIYTPEEQRILPKTLTTTPVIPTLENIRYDAIFGIRVLRKGNFKGLWELVQLDNAGKRSKVLTDANSRGMILTMINKYICKIVVAM